MSQGPLISIITPCLNGEAFVREAIQSVQRQDYPHMEHLVVDGGSEDGTLDVLKDYPQLRVISEPDRGLYHAINKGIDLAQGEVIGLLNCDDLYDEDLLADMARAFSMNPGAEMIYGDATVFEEACNGIRVAGRKHRHYQGRGLSFEALTQGVPLTNARFFRRGLFHRLGVFDDGYRVTADLDFLLRAWLKDVREIYLARTIYHYRRHAGSLTINAHHRHRAAIVGEHLTMAERYLESGDVGPEAKRYFRLWHARETSEMTLLSLRALRAREAEGYAKRGCRLNPHWPLRLIRFSLGKTVGYLRRRRAGASLWGA